MTSFLAELPQLLLLLLLLLAVPSARSQLAGRPVSSVESDKQFACNSCKLEDELHFFILRSRVQEHSVPDSFTVGVSGNCEKCVVFDRLPSTSDLFYQGNWTIDRDGNIRFDHRPHKTGVARLNITVEEVSGSSNYTAITAYFVVIEEDPDYPAVFASQAGFVAELTDFDSVRYQYRNLTLSVEQNTGNNTAYADLLFTAGVFDYDSDEAIRVELSDDEAPRLGRLINELNASISLAVLGEPPDCDLADSERLALRNLTEWDTGLTVWHPCNLSLPYDPPELSWFSHLVRYRPGLQQTGIDRFALTYIDKYRLQARLYVRVHILQNPCVNEGRCWGPSWDPDCVSNVRSEGFFNQGYLCQCPTGWVGDRCEIDFDDCSSSPCPSPYLCVDKFRGYDCVCPENLANCQPLLPAWQLAAILLGLAACVCAIAAVLILASQRAPIVLPLAKSRPASQIVPPLTAEAVEDAENDDDNDDDEASQAERSEPQSPQMEEVQPMANNQHTPTPPTPEPPMQPAPAQLRPPNPEPDDGEKRRRSFQRGSIFIPRRRQQDDWRTDRRQQPSSVLFVEEVADKDDVGDYRDGGASPSDALRLRQLRQELHNQQALQEF